MNSIEENKSKLFKQRLFRTHAAAGIVFSLIMYISLFFGIFAIFLPYIQNWEKPSRHIEFVDVKTIEFEPMLETVLLNPDYPKNNIYIELPGFRGEPLLKISHRFAQTKYYNPITQDEVQDEGRTTQLGNFLNEMHYGRPFTYIGKIIFGLNAVGVMLLIVGGVILVLVFKFKGNGKNQQAVFSNWHRKIFIVVFPIFFLVVLTGALMNVGYSSSKPMTYMVSQGEKTDIFSLIGPVLKENKKTEPARGEEIKMLSINELLKKAIKINPDLKYQEIKLINWKYENSKVEFIAYNPYRPFLNGVYNKPKVILSGVDGALIEEVKVMDANWSVLLSDALYFIHLLYDVDSFTRFLTALIMIASAVAVGFAVMLFLEKKAKKFEGNIPFYHWMGKLSLAVIIGVIPATALMFNLQWLLPLDLENRVFIQKTAFMNMWIFTLFWSFYRINSYQASKELLAISGVLFIMAPVLHLFVLQMAPLDLFIFKMYEILNIDLVLFFTGIASLIISKKLPLQRDEAKIFWTKKKGLN